MKFSKELILIAVFLPLFGGCAVCTDCGNLVRKNEVTTIFTSLELVPEYNYFYNGPFQRPKAILGIDKSLSVEGKFWNPVELTQDQLTNWVQEINTRPQAGSAAGVNGQFEGFEILDPESKRVGIWYSNYDWGVFKFPGENRIIVYSPSYKPGAGSFSINTQM